MDSISHALELSGLEEVGLVRSGFLARILGELFSFAYLKYKKMNSAIIRAISEIT